MEKLYHPFRQELFDWTISVNPAANVQICCLAQCGPCVRHTIHIVALCGEIAKLHENADGVAY